MDRGISNALYTQISLYRTHYICDRTCISLEELSMKVLYTVNNYILGAKVKSTTTDKIILQNRIDKTHTEIVYQFENIRQKESCDKILAKKGKIIEV